jgi:hypothetical protein
MQDVLHDRPDLLVSHLQPGFFRTVKDQSIQEFGDYTFKNEVDLLQRFRAKPLALLTALTSLSISAPLSRPSESV